MSQVGAAVYIDGIRIADGTPGHDGDDVLNVLDEVSIAWGRQTTVDQPEASTFSLTLVNPEPRSAALVAHGAHVTVTATGSTYQDPGQSVFEGGGFGSGQAPLVPLQQGTAVVIADPQFDDYGLQLTGDAHGAWEQIWPKAAIAPRQFVPVGTLPDAWDDLPKAQPGQTWHVEGWARGAPDTHLVIGLAGFSSPWDRAPQTADAAEVIATGEWQYVGADVVIPQPSNEGVGLIAGKWVGITCEIWGDTRRTWDLDPSWPTWIIAEDQVTADWGRGLFDSLQLLAPTGEQITEVNVADGRIQDITWSHRPWWDGTGWVDAALLKATVADFTVELAGRRIGDEPWPAEQLLDRVGRIQELSGGIPIDVAAGLARTVMSWHDVDSQPPIDLLRDLAQSVDGVLWIQSHPAIGGPYLRMEDPSTRASGRVLAWDGGQVVIESHLPADALTLTSCDMLDSAEWVQNAADVITRVSVTWLEEVHETDPDTGKDSTSTTEHTVTVVDEQLETARGINGMSVSTLLNTDAAAHELALRLLSRLRTSSWRLTGAEVREDLIEDPLTVTSKLIAMLDSSARSGRSVNLTGLPEWGPVGPDTTMFLEGGTYEFQTGQWALKPILSNTTGLGSSARTWDLQPDWRTWDFDPAIAAADLNGVTVPDSTREAA